MSTVFILHFALSLRFTLSLQSAFYTQSAFYPWSAVCSLQSAVCVLHWPLSQSFQRRERGGVIEQLVIEPGGLFQALRYWKDAKVKGTRKVFSRFIFVFARSQFSGPDNLGARNRLSLVRREKSRRKVSLSVFSLAPDLLFDCSRVYEYAKIRTVLQSLFQRS